MMVPDSYERDRRSQTRRSDVARWRSSLGAATLVVVAIIGAGCSVAADDTSKAATTEAQPYLLETRPELTFKQGSLNLVADPSLVNESISSDRAYAALMKTQFSALVIQQKARPALMLGAYTDSQYGDVDKAGVLHPKFSSVPAWMVLFEGVNISEMSPSGGPSGHEPPLPTVGDFLVVFNAKTGEFMIARGLPDDAIDPSPKS